ncbi:rubredoxin [Lachnospiraceae bacterium PFB1-21]
MVRNAFVVCDACGYIINLRMQTGFNDIPVHIQCPNCETSMDGNIKAEPYGIENQNTHLQSEEPEESYSYELL